MRMKSTCFTGDVKIYLYKRKIITNTGVPKGNCSSAILLRLLGISPQFFEEIRTHKKWPQSLKGETSYIDILPEHLLNHSYSE